MTGRAVANALPVALGRLLSRTKDASGECAASYGVMYEIVGAAVMVSIPMMLSGAITRLDRKMTQQDRRMVGGSASVAGWRRDGRASEQWVTTI